MRSKRISRCRCSTIRRGRMHSIFLTTAPPHATPSGRRWNSCASTYSITERRFEKEPLVADSEDLMKAEFRKAAPYADDAMNLPVESVEAAIPFYTSVMGFRLVSREHDPMQRAVLARDQIQIGLAENG